MALPPQNSDAFFREVDEDLRRDRLTVFVRRHGATIAVAVGAVLLALALGLWWRSYRASQAGREGERFVAVLNDLDQNRTKADDPRLARLGSSAHAGYRAMARLTQAAIAARMDNAAAVKSYRAVADDTGLPQPARDLAMIRATTLEFDALAPAEIIARMKPLAQPGSPWYGSAGELTGAAYLKQNRRDLAGPLFAAIARDSSVPGSLRGRAAGMATALGQDVGTIAGPAALKE